MASELRSTHTAGVRLKPDDPVAFELHDMVEYTQMVFEGHTLSKHRQVWRLFMPINRVFKHVRPQNQVIGLLDLDKVERLSDALSEVFDTIEAQLQNGTWEKKAKAMASRKGKAVQVAGEPGVGSLVSDEATVESTAPVDTAKTRRKVTMTNQRTPSLHPCSCSHHPHQHQAQT